MEFWLTERNKARQKRHLDVGHVAMFALLYKCTGL